MNIHVLFFEKKKKNPTSGGGLMCRDPESSEPTWAHCGKLFSDSPTAPSDRWPTSPSWTCHEGLPLSFLGDLVHFPTTLLHLFLRPKTGFSELTFSFFVSIFLACLTAVAGVKRFVLLFSGRLYSKID